MQKPGAISRLTSSSSTTVSACSPFRVAWWAASFPLAPSAVTALRYAAVAGSPVMDGIALLILGIVTLVIAVFAVQTLAGIARGRLQEIS